METKDDSKTHPVCIFYGGTLSGVRQKRFMFGFVVGFIMEPVYARDKHGNANRSDIIKRQTYVRSPRDDAGGALGYILHAVEDVT